MARERGPCPFSGCMYVHTCAPTPPQREHNLVPAAPSTHIKLFSLRNHGPKPRAQSQEHRSEVSEVTREEMRGLDRIHPDLLFLLGRNNCTSTHPGLRFPPASFSEAPQLLTRRPGLWLARPGEGAGPRLLYNKLTR